MIPYAMQPKKVGINLSSTKYIQPGSTIGIIGGGQLGKMLAQSAKTMGYRVGILDPGENCSASQVSDFHFQAAFTDEQALLDFSKQCDIITYEFENINLATLEKIIQEGAYMPQGSHVLATTQDRIHEKDFLSKAQVPVGPYRQVDTQEDLDKAVQALGYPSVLKTRRMGYDGKGQVVLKSADDLTKAQDLLANGGPCILEAFVDFIMEASVMVFRNQAGQITSLPVSENIHKNHILHQSIVPARMSDQLRQQAEATAKQVAQAIDLVGILGIELFITEDQVLVNELAPRPHNSGHYSIEACEYSQFDLHIRSICGLDFPQNQLLSPVIMVNVLGQDQEPVIQAWPQHPEWHLHLYGKGQAKDNRKMGHITVLTQSIEESLSAFDQTGIWKESTK